MKLKVQAFKKSGKFYTEDIYSVADYPKAFNQKNDTTIGELRKLQEDFCYNLFQDIKKGKRNELCPVTSWEGYYFVFDGIFKDNEFGFMTYIWDTNETI